jgi:transcriptional repressor NrdR
MVCIYCGAETKVTNSRHQKRSNQVWRRRKCLGCGAIFTSHEAIDFSTALIVDKKGRSQPFLSDILYSDILQAMKNRGDAYTAAREITNTIIVRLLVLRTQSISPADISRVSGEVLRHFDKQSWLRFVAEHPSLQ